MIISKVILIPNTIEPYTWEYCRANLRYDWEDVLDTTPETLTDDDKKTLFVIYGKKTVKDIIRTGIKSKRDNGVIILPSILSDDVIELFGNELQEILK